MTITRVNEVKHRCEELRGVWAERNRRFKVWYELIQMVDKLVQDNMESFVGNDPRAAFNLTTHMLDQKIPHRIRTEQQDLRTMRAASIVERLFDTAWRDVDKVHRQRGRESFMRDFISFLIATGWYAIFANVDTSGRFQAEVLNPAEVYQDWDEVLWEVARITVVSSARAKRIAESNGWKLDREPNGDVKIYDNWKMSDNGKVPYNSVVIDNTLVKYKVNEPRFDRIPIFTGPAGGLPDTGVITGDVTKWRGEIGQSSMVTNEQIFFQTNKWWTFMMQLLRDTAQPATWERSSQSTPIIRPQDKFKRGAHYKLGPNDEVGFMVPPPIPMELRSMQLDMEAMAQRGGVSHALYGVVGQSVSSFVMSQITQSAHMMAKPFHDAIVNSITDIDNFWFNMARKFGYEPYGFSIPDDLPEDIEITANYDLRVPGDAANRATFSRMMNPNFRLTQHRIYDEFWPEVKNPREEMARLVAEDALSHPLRSTAALIQGFREEALILREAGDTQGHRLFNRMADLVEASLSPGQPPQQPQRRESPGVAPWMAPGEGGQG